MNYTIENLSIDNANEYAKVNALAWKQSYKGIVADEYLEEINTDESIDELTEKLKGYVVNNPDHFFLLRVKSPPIDSNISLFLSNSKCFLVLIKFNFPFTIPKLNPTIGLFIIPP